MSHPDSGKPSDSNALEREVFLLRRKLERTRLAMRLLENAKDRYDSLYFQAITHLSESLELNEKMVSVAPLGVAVFVAATGKCIMANTALARILGAEDPGQIYAGDFREMPNLQGIGLLEAAGKALALGKEQRLEINLVTSFGKRVWMDCVMAPFVARSEKHLMAMVNDTTERHVAEEARRHAQKMESLALMAGGIAHDFNNLFQVLLSNLEMVHSGRLGSEHAGQAFERMLDCVSQAQTLSGRLLEYSGKGFRNSRTLNLYPFLAEDLPRLSSLAGRNVLLEDATPSSSQTFQGDPDQLRQVVGNLVVNAAEATTQRARAPHSAQCLLSGGSLRPTHRRVGGPSSGRALPVCRRFRSGLRNSRGTDTVHMRPLLHDQGDGAWPGAVGCPGHPSRPRGRLPYPEPTRSGINLQGPFPGGGSPGG